MERKIGEIFEYNGEWYQCVKSVIYCPDCAFFRKKCNSQVLGKCDAIKRSDKENVIFKKLEKVGEPYTDYCPSGRVIYFQRYKCYQKPAISKETIIHWADDISVSIEIKQTKENMEEKKTNFVEAINALCKRYNMSDGVRTDFMSELKEIIKDKEKCNLKPFNLEAAKAGKPICTRDGHKARIICFDRISGDDYYKIVACVTAFDGDFEEVLSYGIDGYIVDSQNPKDDDLMMLPEKKEGWVNIVRGSDGSPHMGRGIFQSKEEAENTIKAFSDNLIDTIKITWEE